MKEHHKGIHHITALAGDAQRNADFYVKTLGMRLVKKTVNQDDPGTYHLFYGNQVASSGASLTFFPWPQAVKGETGTGEAIIVSFLVPDGSQDYWHKRLKEFDVSIGELFTKFGKQVLPFEDPDGLTLELVFDEVSDEQKSNREGNVPKECAIRGFWGVTLSIIEEEPIANVLQQVFGFKKAEKENNKQRYTTDAPIGHSVIIKVAESQKGKSGRGTIHHIAFRAKDDKEEAEMREKVVKLGLNATSFIDRHWFRSVYFRSPAGVLFEIATDGPGYALDEAPEHLGEKLILAPWLESQREAIEEKLPEINI